MFNRYRFISSGLFFLFSIYCLVWNPALPFSLPRFAYIIALFYFAVFPIRDLLPLKGQSLCKGRQYAVGFRPAEDCGREEISRLRHTGNRRAASMAFWFAFMAAVGTLFFSGVINRIWIFFFFALSNFSVYFAVFFWCPFYAFFVRPECCMECRIYGWDHFFSYSFLVFLPSVYTLPLVLLGLFTLLKWEAAHWKHPERFYKKSNACLQCEPCDHEACKQGKKYFFSQKLKEGISYEDDHCV